jgi:hypothetical protein
LLQAATRTAISTQRFCDAAFCFAMPHLRCRIALPCRAVLRGRAARPYGIARSLALSRLL